MKLLLTFAIALLLWAAAASAAEADLRAAFQKYIAVQNAHDLAALKPLLLDSPDFLWISGGVAIWGRDAALRKFAALYKGTWKLQPNMAAFKEQQLGNDVVVIFVPVAITVAPPGKPSVRLKSLMSQIYFRAGGDWKVAKILPAPAGS
jgi:hypothetical protein